ncbi:hypothetical protein [Paenibacillus hamazuiensis]|uniref:hypothetical protein n=1 Tax=Paenibacillus hamazuiensis TaxID=2936508 RepID=UPI00200CABFF|nr:hypothetical protein [Paenibacillus hamazuiensis]
MTKTSSNAVWNIVRNPQDAVAAHDSVMWATAHLQEICRERGITLSDASDDRAEITIVIAGAAGKNVPESLQRAGLSAGGADSFALVADHADGRTTLTAVGGDSRGLMYALLEIADIIRHSERPAAALQGIAGVAEQPSLPVRSINRLFVSEVEDKPWFYDTKFWSEYLTELATHRFNRFHLALGMGYDYGHDPGVQDNYFCFAYPYFLQVPGYDVSVKGLPEGEAERNLAALQFISEEAHRRGIHFQLGIWTHAYDPSESPNAKYSIEGVHPQNHAAYCRDGLRALLEACPHIDGVTIRTHYEGGIPEPAHEFWAVVFSGVAQCGRKVEIDLHSKGVDEQMLGVAVDTGLPIVVSPKYWAEHMGPPYHQAAIRPLELPAASTERPDLMAITATYRRFTRYGYADFLREDRKFDVLFRIWPGTQRVLLWGDPEMAAGYGRMGGFCGALGVELCEPLTFKARKGSGSPGGRDPYADESLKLGGAEWKKYLYSYRIWGRLLYNPDTNPSGWRRYLCAGFGEEAAPFCEAALAHASRILPLLTAAHLPSAANNHFWPEMYANLPIVNTGARSHLAFDTPAPGTFGAVSPLDPALFYRIDEFADDAAQGSRRKGKYTPLEVADRLDSWAKTAHEQLAQAAGRLGGAGSRPSVKRFTVDVTVQAELGLFFAEKLRAGVAYAIFERTQEVFQLREAVKRYRAARAAWLRIVEATQGVYRDDITFGYVPYMRGHWADRLPGIDEDLAAMEQQLLSAGEAVTAADVEIASAGDASAEVRELPGVRHDAPARFRRNEAIPIRITVEGQAASARLHYRLVHQAQPYTEVEMARTEDGAYTAEIPASYTDKPYPIMYFFEMAAEDGTAWLSPGFNAAFSNQPYYVIRQSD